MYEKFEYLLKLRNLKPAYVAKHTGLYPATLSSWKVGRACPKRSTMQKIADFFEVPISYFYDDLETTAKKLGIRTINSLDEQTLEIVTELEKLSPAQKTAVLAFTKDCSKQTNIT